MATCKEIYGFLSQISTKNVTTPLAEPDATAIAQAGLVQFLTADQYQQLRASVPNLGAEREAEAREAAQRVDLAREVRSDERKTQSILFHLERKEKQATKLQRETDDEARLKALDNDLAKKEQDVAQLVSQLSLLDTVTPCGDRYVGLTGLGALELRNLAIRLYRVSDQPFGTYWEQSQKITQELTDLAASGADYFARLAPNIAGAERSHLWAISIGLSKTQPEAAQGSAAFAATYRQLDRLTNNVENRLMAAEILFSLPHPLSEEYPTLLEVLKEVQRLKVPKESALGIASILLLGQRADGTIALPNLAEYLRVTRSYESAALLAIVNLPIPELTGKFQWLRGMFGSWGYRASEDVELSSAYLAVSELPVEGISTKLAIIAKGLSTYLEYPLVAASVLTTLSTLEANETLNLLEHAYDIVGRRASQMTRTELICLAVRMLHGIRNELVGPLDTTAAAAPSRAGVPGVYGPRFLFVPILVAYNAYWSTFSGVSGVHPGHVHGFGGGAGGFVG